MNQHEADDLQEPLILPLTRFEVVFLRLRLPPNHMSQSQARGRFRGETCKSDMRGTAWLVQNSRRTCAFQGRISGACRHSFQMIPDKLHGRHLYSLAPHGFRRDDSFIGGDVCARSCFYLLPCCAASLGCCIHYDDVFSYLAWTSTLQFTTLASAQHLISSCSCSTSPDCTGKSVFASTNWADTILRRLIALNENSIKFEWFHVGFLQGIHPG